VVAALDQRVDHVGHLHARDQAEEPRPALQEMVAIAVIFGDVVGIEQRRQQIELQREGDRNVAIVRSEASRTSRGLRMKRAARPNPEDVWQPKPVAPMETRR